MRNHNRKSRLQNSLLGIFEVLEPRMLMTAAPVLHSLVSHATGTPALSVFDGDGSGDDGSGDDGSGDSGGDSSGDPSGSGTQPGTEPGTQPATPPDSQPGDGDSTQPGDGDSTQPGDSGNPGDDDSSPGDDSGCNGSVVYPPGDPYHLTLKALSATTIQLSWYGDLANTTGFEIARKDPGRGFVTIATVDSATQFDDTSLSPKTTYSYAVIAFNDAGYSNYSNIATLATPDIQHPPVGWLDIASGSQVAGWAFDANTPRTAVRVSLSIDGTIIDSSLAAMNRSDLVPHLGFANHGFAITYPALSPGIHRIDIFATDTTTGVGSLIATRTINTNHAPTGFLDLFNQSTLAGWAYDSDTPSTGIHIEYAIDNKAPVLATANANRPDLIPHIGSANHGFAISLPPLAPGIHSIRVYALDSTSNSLVLLVQKTTNVPIPVSSAPLTGWLDIISPTRIAGWARNPANPSASVYVRIDIDNVPGTPFLANAFRSDLAATFGTGTLAFDEPIALSPGQHIVTIYLLAAPASSPKLLASRIVFAA